MKKIVILPGGYHPYHAGHYSLYKAAQKKYPDAEVYVAASDDTKTRPFPFEIKKKLAKLAGVDETHFVQVKSPFRPVEIINKYDPENDIVIFIRSEKDKTESPIPGGTKKDGSPTYFQPISKEMVPFGQHAYMDYLPTIEFGPGIKSATEIRNTWPNLSERQKLAMIMSMYPITQKNEKLAKVAMNMLDIGINGDSLNESESNKEEKIKSIDIDRSSANLTSDETETFQRILRMYPEASDPLSAILKYIIHSVEQSDSEDYKHEQRLSTIERDIKNLQKQISKTNPDDELSENEIVPDGGAGTWDEESIKSKLNRDIDEIQKHIQSGQWSNAYHVLYKAGMFQTLLKAMKDYSEEYKDEK